MIEDRYSDFLIVDLKKIPKDEVDAVKDMIDGYNTAKDFTENAIKIGHHTGGGSTCRIFCEALGFSIRNKEYVSNAKIDSFRMLMSYNDTPFNRGVYKYLVDKANEYMKEYDMIEDE